MVGAVILKRKSVSKFLTQKRINFVIILFFDGMIGIVELLAKSCIIKMKRGSQNSLYLKKAWGVIFCRMGK
jgi:hypothetical protein